MGLAADPAKLGDRIDRLGPDTASHADRDGKTGGLTSMELWVNYNWACSHSIMKAWTFKQHIFLRISFIFYDFWGISVVNSYIM